MVIPINPLLDSNTVFLMTLLLGSIGTTALILGIRIMTSRFRTRSNHLFGTLNLLVAAWNYCSILQLISPDLLITWIISKISLLAFDLIPLFLLFLVISFGVDFEFKSSQRSKRVFLIIPSVLTGLDYLGLLTNELHYLYWNDPWFTFPIVTAGITRNIMFFFRMILVYGIMAAALIYLLRLYAKARAREYVLFKKQARIFFYGAMIPFGFSIVHFLRIIPLSHLYDITPFGITLTFIIFYWGVFYERVIDPVSVARDLMLSNLPRAYIVFNLSQEIVFMNPQCMKYLLLPPQQVIGHTVPFILQQTRFMQSNPKIEDKLTQYVTDTLNEGSRQEIEVEISRDFSSASTWLLAAVKPIYYRNTSVIIGGLLSLEDFTKRKKAEDMADFLQSLLRHDINNKMIVIHGYLSLLARQDLAPEQKILIKKAQTGCEDGMELIAKINSLRKINSSLLESARKISINPILKEVVTSNSSRAADAGITIELHISDEETTVQGGILLKELFSNLVENTIVHSNSTLLAITIEEHDDSLVILVEDDGKGIPDNYKDRIFRRGFRGAGSKGSGLGLYLVKTIAEVYGGGIEVKDSKLGGARFEVTLKKN